MAHIHDSGFSQIAKPAATAIHALLTRTGPAGDLIVELGCGSGRLAREFVDLGYRVHGVDISEGMIELASSLVPEATFTCRSLYEAEIPRCACVVSVGECLNYVSAPGEPPDWFALFGRVYASLAPSGWFVFDLAEPGQAGADPVTGWKEGDNWVVLVRKQEKDGCLTREIVNFRESNGTWRRGDEVHYQALPKRTTIQTLLEQAGFLVEIRERYGDTALAPRHAAFFCFRKP